MLCIRALRTTDSLLQELLNRLSGLPRPVLILDQSETHVALAERAESDTRRHGDQRFFQQQLRKFERAFGAILLWNRRPDEHRSPRRLYRPPRAIETRDERVATLLIDVPDLLGVLGALPKRDDGSDLDRLEDSVVEIAFDARQRSDHFLVPQTKSHPPARHIEALRHGI